MWWLLCLLGVAFVGFAWADSPREQLEAGTAPESISCNPGMALMMRPAGMPACVLPASVERLDARGWIMIRAFAADMTAQTRNGTEPALDVTDLSNERTPEPPAAYKPPMISPNTITASGGFINMYVYDQDLNLARGAAERVDARDLLEFFINDVRVPGPSTMMETGPDTGKFLVRFEIPKLVDGVPPEDGDIVIMHYLDNTDYSGDPRTVSKSFRLHQTMAKLDKDGGDRIGREFTVRLYEPDANLDSRDEDRIPLSSLEYRGEGGIRTTLANPKFDPNRSALVETGPNTGTFEVILKMPRELDGVTIHIGDWYEIRYIDSTLPSDTSEKIVLKGRIG